MKKVIAEMPIVSQCDITKCSFNMDRSCHAKAITIGDGSNPGCDTYFINSIHTRDKKRAAGVGACKVSDCKFNNVFECFADHIEVGILENEINCLTFEVR